MINGVLIPNAIAMLLLLILLLSANSVSRHTLLLDSKIFVMMVTCNFIQCVGEITAYYIDGIMLPGFHALNLVVNCMLFIVNIFFAFHWVIYADYKIYEDYEHVKKHSRKLFLPALAVVIASAVNLFVPVFFRITPDNHYQRTMVFIIPYIVTYFYLLYGTVYIYRHKNEAKKYVFLPATLFMIPIMLGSGLQFFFYGLSTAWIGVAIALVAVYVNVQNEVSYTDALSGLYTRIFMYQYLENALRRKDLQKKIAGIMLDIDDFKTINDFSGHLTGDDAIRSAGNLLHGSLPNDLVISRYGGDEFVIFQEIYSEKEIEKTLDLIRKAEDDFNAGSGKNYVIHFSTGWGILNPEEDTADSFIDRIDYNMYENKKERKQQARMHRIR